MNFLSKPYKKRLQELSGIIRENNLVHEKKDLIGRDFYHGTVLETWKQTGDNNYLFISDEIEIAKNHANDRADSIVREHGVPSTAIVVKIIIDESIANLEWHVDDDLGNWSRPPLNYQTWQDSYNAVGTFVIQGNYDINKFPIVYSFKHMTKGHED